MNIYEGAIDKALEFWVSVVQERFGEDVDKAAIKAEFQKYFDDGTEQGMALRQQLLQEYGPEEMQKQMAARARGVKNA